MAIAPISYDTPSALSAFDFTPLTRLGEQLKAQQNSQMLANLAQRYDAAPSSSVTPSSIIPSSVTPSSVTPSSVTPSSVTPSSGGTSAPFAAPATTGDVDAAIRATAAAAGMDVPTWKAIASIESSLNPSSNFNRPTRYKGLFQIGSRGEGSEWSRHGSGDIYNPMDNARAAAALASANNARFRQTFNRDPTPVETYMMHQQGLGFYTKGITTNITGNPYPGMSGPQTPASFAEGWGREIERRKKYFGKSEETGD